jgi:hypothetical protein
MNLTRLLRLGAVVAVVASLSGCAGGLSAARGKTGGPITIELAFEQNPTARNPEQIAQLVEWMAPDLQRILTRAGYNVIAQPNANAFQPAPDHYLLFIHIVNYNAGSKAARMLVGFGAGTLTLDTNNELYAGPGQLVMRSNGATGSSRDWNAAARRINEQVAREITVALNR